MTETITRNRVGRGHLAPAPTPDELEAAVRAHGSVTKAAGPLGVNLRTLERQIARMPQLHAAAARGREAWWDDAYPHGHRRRYEKARCRCDLCRAANAEACRLGIRLLEVEGAGGAVYVAGTLDIAEARPVARAQMAELMGYDVESLPAHEAEYIEERLSAANAEVTWMRKVPAPPNNAEGWTWVLLPAEAKTPGAFAVVIFR